MTIVILTGLILSALYLYLIGRLFAGLGRVVPGSRSATPSVSVIIAARNENACIDACLSALADQTYPHETFEVLVVDDGSGDDTASRAAAWQDRLDLRVLPATENAVLAGKKRALDTGIRASTGELILTTDADCRPSPDWIRSTAACFDSSVGLVAGPAPLARGRGPLGALLSFQALVVNTLAAGSMGAGFPLTCSGRNLAYRRLAFEQAGGFASHAHLPGGDDVFVLRDIAALSTWQIRYNPDPGATVWSSPHEDRQIRRQMRYQSKSAHLGPGVLIMAIGVYILHLLLLASPFLGFLDPDSAAWLAGLFTVKIVADFALLWRAAARLQQRRHLVLYPVVAVLIPLYIVLFSAAGFLARPRWS